MKKAKILFLLLSILSISVNAQSSEKQKELGLTMNNIQLDKFGITYKFGKPSAMWRLSALSIDLSDDSRFINEDADYNTSRISFSLSAGREFRKVVKNDFEFRYGLDIAFNYGKTKNDRTNIINAGQNEGYESTSYQPEVKVVLGINYVLNEKIVFGFEALPGIGYRYSETIIMKGENEEIEIEDKNHSVNFGTSGEFALFSVAYRF